MAIQTAPGERVIWQGQPAQGIHFSPQDAFAVPFSLFWLFIVVAIFVVTLSGQATNVDPLTYVILPFFLLIGLYMAFGRFLFDRAARRKTRYYLTNQRALIESGLFRSSRRSVNLAAVPEIRFRSGRNGKGTVQFGTSAGPFGMMPSSWPGAAQFLPPSFDGIEGAERVYELALTAQREAQAGR
jgi:hypothetical protein